jgi:hypothetical protein
MHDEKCMFSSQGAANSLADFHLRAEHGGLSPQIADYPPSLNLEWHAKECRGDEADPNSMFQHMTPKSIV